MLLLLDFDGTITERDTLDAVVQRYAPETWKTTEAALRRGEVTLNDVIRHQFEQVAAPLDEVLAFLRDSVVVRPGLPQLIDFCRERFVDPIVVSSGFHELIEPVLRWHGIALPVVAHRATFSSSGTTVTFLERATCPVCGEPCKRVDIPRLADGRQVGYVGDGWSDRCGAEAADIAFATGPLASYLTERGTSFVPFSDFDDVRRGLRDFLA